MIVRHFVECATCNHAHTVRIQVGHNPYQEHTFGCMECHEEMVLGMHCFPETASVEITELNNCVAGSEEGTIVNLSPDFPIPEGDINRNLAFPSLEHKRKLSKAQQNAGIEAPSFGSVEDYRDWALQQKGIPETWSIVKKGWSLTLKDRTDIAEKVLCEYLNGKYEEKPQLNHVLFDFCSRLLLPNQYHLFLGAAKYCENLAKERPDELARFREYYVEHLQKDHLERYFETFKEYFYCFSDMSQTLTHIQYDLTIPDDHVASSYAFARTKLFYGNAFETLTTTVSVLACLNNIGRDRRFDEFEKMTLKQYMSINKAKRCDPFKGNQELSAFCDCLESTIRNASHHGGMKLSNNGAKIEYRSGGSGSVRTMPYVQYLNYCNRIMLSCCALLALELALAF